MSRKTVALLLTLGIAVPFFALAGYFCIGLAGWSSHDFGLFLGMIIWFIFIGWWLLVREAGEGALKVRNNRRGL